MHSVSQEQAKEKVLKWTTCGNGAFPNLILQVKEVEVKKDIGISVGTDMSSKR